MWVGSMVSDFTSFTLCYVFENVDFHEVDNFFENVLILNLDYE